jgi:ribose transport system substrate-binding protein
MRTKKQKRQILAAVAILIAGGVALAGCSSSPSTSSSGAPTVASSAKDVVAQLPAALKSQYVGATDPVAISPYQTFKKVKGPWKICYSDSYEGNAWRVSVKDELARLAAQYKNAGIVSGFNVVVSNNNVAQQNQQIRQFVSQGCSAILTIAGSSSGLNQSIAAAKSAGIPVITISGAVTSPDAINVDSNYYVMGADMAKAASAASKNVLMIEGIAGNPIAVEENNGAKAEFAKTGAKIVAEVNGNWTPSDTKAAVLTTLTTNSASIGAVWSTGSESAVIAQAFKDSSRPGPVITASITGDALGFWKQNPSYFKFDGVALTPTWAAQTGFNVALRTLDGKGPKLSTMMVPIPAVTQSSLSGLYQSCMTPNTTSVFPVVKDDPLPSNLMDAYFDKSGNVGPFQYSLTPGACAK